MSQHPFTSFLRNLALCAAPLAAFAAFGTPAQAQGDKIYLPGQDKPLAGNPTNYRRDPHRDRVSDLGGGKIALPARRGSHQYGGPEEIPFTKALNAMSTGDFAGALAILDPMKPTREIFAPRRLYLIAKCNEALDHAAEAESSMGSSSADSKTTIGRGRRSARSSRSRSRIRISPAPSPRPIAESRSHKNSRPSR